MFLVYWHLAEVMILASCTICILYPVYRDQKQFFTILGIYVSKDAVFDADSKKNENEKMYIKKIFDNKDFHRVPLNCTL
jgi:hypothetical protein